MTSKAVFLDFATLGSDGPDPAPLLEVLPGLELHAATPTELVAERIADAEFVLANKARLDHAAIAEARNLRYIGLTATGTDNVDLAAARRAGVAVTNIRAYCTRSVVEHVFAVLLNLAHSIVPYHRAVRGGEWQKSPNFCLLDFPIRELSAMTLGIVGYGELGRAVAETASRFGMSVIVAARRGGRIGEGRLAFAQMLARADVVSLHCPLTEETRRMFGRAEFEQMKPGAILINTARGALVDSAALVRALREKMIGGAAIDVLPQEPPVDGDPLLDYAGDNLILTPHIAWATLEARQNALCELAENVRAFLAGGDRNRVA
jgi:glycerate dehydrogenase